MVAVTEALEPDEILISLRDFASRQTLIDMCGQHSWRLHLNPETPDWVEIYCQKCPSSLNDVWAGAIGMVHIQIAEYTVVDGTHTATMLVDVPIDVYVRESKVMDRRTFEFVNELSVDIQFRAAALTAQATEEEAEGTGTGWCAPSP